MEKCIIPGCPHEGGNQLGIRCRRPDTTAVWAPNCNVFLCDEHAESGCCIDIRITPANDGKITTNVSVSGCDESISRVTMIRRK